MNYPVRQRGAVHHLVAAGDIAHVSRGRFWAHSIIEYMDGHLSYRCALASGRPLGRYAVC